MPDPTQIARWSALGGLAMEGAKVAVLIVAGITGWLVALAPPRGQEGFMDYAVVAGVLFLTLAIGLSAVAGYTAYRIWRG
jgi:Na+/melibiose symporter-like transporter